MNEIVYTGGYMKGHFALVYQAGSSPHGECATSSGTYPGAILYDVRL
jgi:hypothetical protein